MIIDSLNNIEKYAPLHPLFPKAIEHICSIDFIYPILGKTELLQSYLYADTSKSLLRDKGNAKLEVHNTYIDIQLPISDSEIFGWNIRKNLTKETAPFDVNKDIQFFNDDYSTQLTVHPGQFIIFFPEDAHAPCIGQGEIIKTVIKVKQ